MLTLLLSSFTLCSLNSSLYYIVLLLASHHHLCLCHFHFVHLDIYFIVIFLLFTWTSLFWFPKTLIMNLNHKKLKATWTIWLLSFAWSFGLMDLGLEALQPWNFWRPLTYCDTLWILSEVLEVYFKALGCIAYMQVLLWT